MLGEYRDRISKRAPLVRQLMHRGSIAALLLNEQLFATRCENGGLEGAPKHSDTKPKPVP